MSLDSYYRLNFNLAQHHKWDIGSLENLIPFERDIYVELLQKHLEEEKNKNNG